MTERFETIYVGGHLAHLLVDKKKDGYIVGMFTDAAEAKKECDRMNGDNDD
tara:strand:+ start:447 stop:599 length:153 start_codon:yes stop_codon:yes gene_type:complete